MNRLSAACTWSAGIHLAVVAALVLLSREEFLRERNLVAIDFSLQEAGPASLEPAPPQQVRQEPPPRRAAPQPPSQAPAPAARTAPLPPVPQSYPAAATPQEAVLPYAPPVAPQQVAAPAPAVSGTVSASRSAVRSDPVPSPAARIEEAKKRYLKEHFSYIREAIVQRVSYPAMARKMGWQGTAVVKFVVEESGRVSDVRIERASGFPLLDRSAMETVRDAAPFPKPPVRAEIAMPVSYRLE